MKVSPLITCTMDKGPPFKGEVVDISTGKVLEMTGRGFCDVTLNKKTTSTGAEELMVFIPISNLKGFKKLKENI